VTGVGDRVLYALCAAAGLVAVFTLGEVIYQLISHSRLSISHFGLGFLGHQNWAVHFNQFGAAALIYGTLVTSFLALALAAPLGIGIAIYLAMIAPPRVRAVVGPIVEMLAAVPSIIFGLWGIFVLVPFIVHLEPGLNSALGFIPLFGSPQYVGYSIFAAVIVLALMILPIVSSLSRDLFLTVPRELTDGAAALGATRWEVIRGIVLPSTVSGVTAACVLALGRALGEAIAVSFIIGDATAIHPSIFAPASTLAERIATQFPATSTNLQRSSLFYLGLILLVITLFTSIAARVITTRFDVQRAVAL
jgi:phosphate transport system permease protein